MPKRKKKRRRSTDEGSYTCPTCGEQIVIPLDRSGGSEQRYVEDCPVCCNPNVIHLEFSVTTSRLVFGLRQSRRRILLVIPQKHRIPWYDPAK